MRSTRLTPTSWENALVEFFYQEPGTGRMRSDWLIGGGRHCGTARDHPVAAKPHRSGFPDYIRGPFHRCRGQRRRPYQCEHRHPRVLSRGGRRIQYFPASPCRESALRTWNAWSAFSIAASGSSWCPRPSSATRARPPCKRRPNCTGPPSNERAQLAQAWTAVGVN